MRSFDALNVVIGTAIKTKISEKLTIDNLKLLSLLPGNVSDVYSGTKIKTLNKRVSSSNAAASAF